MVGAIGQPDIRSIPLFIVTLARPEILEKRPDWGAAKRTFTSLYLEPLSEPEMRSLLAGLVPGLPEPPARSIVAHAEGIPLYVVETVRMLVAEGRLVPAGDGTYTPAGEIANLPAPETLTALIASRLDGLDKAERSLLLDAAVLGQSFTQVALATVEGAREILVRLRTRPFVKRLDAAMTRGDHSPLKRSSFHGSASLL